MQEFNLNFMSNSMSTIFQNMSEDHYKNSGGKFEWGLLGFVGKQSIKKLITVRMNF